MSVTTPILRFAPADADGDATSLGDADSLGGAAVSDADGAGVAGAGDGVALLEQADTMMAIPARDSPRERMRMVPPR
jgi:hypothetical protein